MNTINLEMLGMTKEEMQERVVNCITDRMINEIYSDEDSNEIMTTSTIGREFQKKTKEIIQQTISDLAEKHILPNVSQYIESLCLQKTNQWGEPRGEKLTFVEFLVQQAENYMTEKVSYDGKSKSESGSYSWNGTQTRLSHMIDKHLHYSIQSAMENALKGANDSISEGIQETVKIKLAEISQKIKIIVNKK